MCAVLLSCHGEGVKCGLQLRKKLLSEPRVRIYFLLNYSEVMNELSDYKLNGAENVLVHCIFDIDLLPCKCLQDFNTHATHTIIKDLGLIKACEHVRSTTFSHLVVFKMKHSLNCLPELNIWHAQLVKVRRCVEASRPFWWATCCLQLKKRTKQYMTALQSIIIMLLFFSIIYKQEETQICLGQIFRGKTIKPPIKTSLL